MTWALELSGGIAPMIHPNETRETLFPCDPKRAVQLAAKGGEID
jgi:hypothetical protein